MNSGIRIIIDELRSGAALRSLGRLVAVARCNSVGDALRLARAWLGAPHFRTGWLSFLEEFAAANGLPAVSVDMVMKPLNQYLLHDLPLGERIRLLRGHYALLAEFAAPRAIAHVWRGDAFEAGRIAGKTGSYALCLGGTRTFLTRKEGEMTLALRDIEGGEILAKVTFLLSETAEGRRGALIGGLQGPRSADAKHSIIAATRDLHGLRPRDAVLLAAFAIADRVGAREAWAVSNAMHVHRARERRQQEKLFVDYDSLWCERGARGALPFGWTFDIPKSPVHTGRTSQGRRRDALKEIVWRLARSGFSGTGIDVAPARILMSAAQ